MVVGPSDYIVQYKGDVREDDVVGGSSTIGEDHIDPDGRPWGGGGSLINVIYNPDSDKSFRTGKLECDVVTSGARAIRCRVVPCIIKRLA